MCDAGSRKRAKSVSPGNHSSSPLATRRTSRVPRRRAPAGIQCFRAAKLRARIQCFELSVARWQCPPGPEFRTCVRIAVTIAVGQVAIAGRIRWWSRPLWPSWRTPSRRTSRWRSGWTQSAAFEICFTAGWRSRADSRGNDQRNHGVESWPQPRGFEASWRRKTRLR